MSRSKSTSAQKSAMQATQPKRIMVMVNGKKRMRDA